MLVLCLDTTSTDETVQIVWNTILEPCFHDERFYLLPEYYPPHMEWEQLVSGRPDLWERAVTLGRNVRPEIVKGGDDGSELLPRSILECKGDSEWETDLVQREGFSEIDEDPTELLYRRTAYPF